MSGTEILTVTDLKKHFPVRRGLLQRAVAEIKAVDGVSFALAAGETLCLVGESGCGKSTVGRLILRLIDATSGDIVFKGENITSLSREAMRDKRQRLQIVFQDPYASLNPRLTAGTIVGEPLENFAHLGRAEREARVRALLARVGLGADALSKYPF
jgi:ABC-type microcin C transport system duplicated ATPase subunit YejF